MSYKSRGKVLVADDDPIIREIINEIITEFTDYKTSFAEDGEEALKKVYQFMPDVILMDVLMPKVDGFELVNKIKGDPETEDIPIIFMTGLSGEHSITKGFELGGIDYILKPFKANILLLRLKAQMKMKKIQDELKSKNILLQDRELHLESLVNKKTQQISQITLAMVSALESANYYNDTDTGNHIKRVSEFAALLANKYGCDRSYINRISLYDSLHDVGKVGIPFKILNFPGRLNSSDFEKMKQHVDIGYKMLDSPAIDDMAKNIIRYHHEKWDGSGYPYHLSGEDIPLEARIVSLADVFDALMHERIYKPAYSLEKSLKIINANKGKHFEPLLIDLFLESIDEVVEINERLK